MSDETEQKTPSAASPKRPSTKAAGSRHAAKAPRTRTAKSKPRTVVSAEDLPRRTLQDCVAVAKQLHDTFAGNRTTWDDLADALKIGKSSNPTKYLFWAAAAYGLINREDGNAFSLSELGRKIVSPTYDGEYAEGLVKAATTPNLLSRFYTDYAEHPIPSDDLFGNVLERTYGVPRERIPEARDLICKNAEFAGVLGAPDAEGRRYLRIQQPRGTGHAPAASGPAAVDSANPEAEDAAGGADWSKVCFYITPIGDDGSEQRRHSDMMLKHVVSPAAEEHGLNVVRADKIAQSGVITKQVLEHLLFAKLCVADLSFNNANVFYELGVRHLCMRACPQLIRKGDKIPFDVSQGRTIVIDTSDPYTITDRLLSARRELSEHIKQAVAGVAAPADDNPVSVYVPGIQVVLPRRGGAS